MTEMETVWLDVAVAEVDADGPATFGPVSAPLVLATCEVIVQLTTAAAAQDGDSVIVNDHDWPAASVWFGLIVTAPPAPTVPAGDVVIVQPDGGAGIVTERTISDVPLSPANAFTAHVNDRLDSRGTAMGLAGAQVMLMELGPSDAMPAVSVVLPRLSRQFVPWQVKIVTVDEIRAPLARAFAGALSARVNVIVSVVNGAVTSAAPVTHPVVVEPELAITCHPVALPVGVEAGAVTRSCTPFSLVADRLKVHVAVNVPPG